MRVDFDLSPDQVALRDAARDLLEGAASSERVRAVLDAPAGYDTELWKQVTAQGWLALALPEGRGGLGLGFVEQAVVAEQIGRHVAPVPVVSGMLALSACLAGDVGAEHVDGLVAGDTLASATFGDTPAVDAPLADVVLVVGAGDVRLHVLEQAPPAEPAMDRTRRLAWLDLPADGGVLVGGAELAARMLDEGAVLYALEMLGASDRMLDVANEYAKVREQFGRPIGSFQAVKHRLADVLVDVEGMRSAAYYAAWAVSTDAGDRSIAASTAKSWCSDASRRVMDSCLQVLGGIGFTWEHDLHLYLKRAQLDGELFGDATFHRRRLATLLRGRVEAGADLW